MGTFRTYSALRCAQRNPVIFQSYRSNSFLPLHAHDPNSMNVYNTEKKLFQIAAMAIALGMLLCLGTAPLYLEEPRRALIALEMVRSGNFWAATQFGEWYYYKPPFFTWILTLFARLGSGFQEFYLRLPTVLSTLGIAGILYGAGKKWVHARFGSVAALVFLGFSSILYYFSVLAEIDLFYALVAFAGILAIYYFGEQERYWALFLTVYLSCAIGVLTKGMPSFAFTAISLLVYFVDKKRFMKLLSLQHIIGIALLAVLLGGYAWKYSQYNNPIYLLETLVGESSERTLAGYTFGEFLIHLATFPLDLLKDLLPGILLGIFLLRRDWRTLLLDRHPFIRFCTLMLAANILVYWFSPGTRLRYVYPLFPFIACLLSWAWIKRKEAPIWAERIFNRSTGVLLTLLAVGMLSLPFIPDFQFLSYRWLLALVASMAFAGLAFAQRQWPSYSLAILFIALAVGRFVFDFTLLPQRAYSSEASRNKQLAQEIFDYTGNAPLYLYGEPKVISFTSSFYVDRLRRQPIRLQDQLQRGQFYLLRADLTGPKDSVLLQTTYNDTLKVLILKK